MIKRILDLFFALLIGVIFLPFGLIISICIMMESEGPVFFQQERVGKNCKIFRIYKFRTMRRETKRGEKSLSDMERMTKVGTFLRKTSLDEMPQILNILKGDMSFIGPRPLLVEYISRYTEYQMRRHEVEPGISGWAQVNGRNAISWEEKFEYDVWYVNHNSFFLDCKIFLRTIWTLFNRLGVNKSSGVTMEEFLGKEQTHDE